jgi:hypothetical protein
VLKQELGLEAELKVGPSGSFQVVFDGQVVAEKSLRGFPAESEIVAAVRARVAV